MFPQPAAELQVLLDELTAKLGVKPKFMTQSPAVEVLKRITRHGDPAALPWLFSLIHSSTTKIREAAEDAVECMLPQLEARQMIELELLVRRSWTRFYCDEHSYRTRTEHGARLATLHSSGWIREKAVSALIRSGDPASLPFVLLRCNDWVVQVRKAAERWFSVHSSTVSASQLAASLPIVAALTERSYGRVSTFATLLIERLTQPMSAPMLMESLPLSDARTRRLLFMLLAQSGALQDTATQSVLIKQRDPIFGILLLKHLRRQMAEFPEGLLDQALSARSATLRRYALHCLSEDQVSRTMPLLSHALFDPAHGVRSFAQYYLLKQVPAEELQSRYAGAMREPQVKSARLATCILGFHEAGGSWPASHYLELGHHKSMQVRVAVLRTFAAAHFEAALPSLKAAFASSEGSSLAKTASAVFQKRLHAWTLNELRGLLGPEHAEAVRMRAFVLLCRRGKWEQLPVLFELLPQSSGAFEHQVLSRLSAWLDRYNDVQSQPNRAQMEQILAAFDCVKNQLNSRLRIQFSTLLQSLVLRE